MRYFLKTFGCQANLADSERISSVCETMGYKKASSEKDADLLIYNTCSVRQTAEDRVFGLNKKIRLLRSARNNKQLKANGSQLKVVLTGCMMHYGEKKLRERLPEINFFIDIKQIQGLPKLLGEKTQFDVSDYLDIPHKSEKPFIAYIPISSGCNNFCTYCIVPHSRGREYSRPTREIIKEAKGAVKNGAKEIWLLGQNVNSYGSEEKTHWDGKTRKNTKPKIKNGCMTFADLLRAINKIPGNFWIRFTSPHPKDFSDDLIKSIRECAKMPKYINLPVQSGSNVVLKKMGRQYTAKHYEKLVAKIRKSISEIAISTDTIVGFPGEMKKQYRDTEKLYKKMKFDMAFIATYSPRPNTIAALTMKDSVSKTEKERRKKQLTAILAKTALEKNKKYIGKIEKVLIESKTRGKIFGRNGAYKLVIVEPDKNKKIHPRTYSKNKYSLIRNAPNKTNKIGAGVKIGQFTDIKITNATPWHLNGHTS